MIINDKSFDISRIIAAWNGKGSKMRQKSHNENSPVKRYYDESENAGSDGHVCHEVVDGAIYHPEGPMRVKEEDKVESAVEQ